jgi:uncharacterized protein YcbK (DUF882 family)
VANEVARQVELTRRRRGAAAFGFVVLLSATHVGALPSSPSARIPTYREMVRAWHTPPDEEPSVTPEGRPSLVLEIINTGERVELAPSRDDGGFSTEDIERAAHALRDHKVDKECTPDARLLDLAYQIVVHFHAKALRIVSAFRTPPRRHSRHGTGHAIDMVVPGTRDADVAQFARSLGFVGVGLYPRSGFVHVDSRDRSYFWVDSSGPGQRGRTVQVYAKAAAAADAKALERGEIPPGPGSSDNDESAAVTLSAAAVFHASLRRRSSN